MEIYRQEIGESPERYFGDFRLKDEVKRQRSDEVKIKTRRRNFIRE
jgi:hypothetical protein